MGQLHRLRRFSLGGNTFSGNPTHPADIDSSFVGSFVSLPVAFSQPNTIASTQFRKKNTPKAINVLKLLRNKNTANAVSALSVALIRFTPLGRHDPSHHWAANQAFGPMDG